MSSTREWTLSQALEFLRSNRHCGLSYGDETAFYAPALDALIFVRTGESWARVPATAKLHGEPLLFTAEARRQRREGTGT